ncbi:ABC transporter substrate-binding protein [Methylocystis sp.]|uniref:ABC transporter substrate-binding protein n=1 Tax=Methylocystis sp. TaxID=1911079 RepID=UPI003DA2C301
MRTNGLWTSGIVAAALAALVLTACGSRVSPEKAAEMRQQTAEAAGLSDPAGGTVLPGTSGDVAAPAVSGEVPGVSTGTAPGVAVPGATTPGGSSNPGTGTGENAPTGTVKVGSCAGLKNQTGITDSEIVLGNVSDISGPVPGLFAAARDGARAYVQYFNTTSNLCGRKLRLLEYDSRTDAGADQVAYAKACTETFATVGSVSILDSGGAGTAQGCGIPDLRAVSLSNERVRCSVCFPAQSSRTGFIGEGPYVQMRKENRAASENAAFLYLNTGGSPILAKGYAETAKQAGWNIKMIQGIDTTEFNYSPYVQRFKSLGIKYVHFVSATPQAARLAKAMEAASFKPDIYQLSQTQYTNEYVETAGAAGNNSLISLPHGLFTAPNAEMRLYLTWLQQVRPGADPSTFGVFAWSAMRLFIENATQLGGKLTRTSLLAEVKKERRWTANDIHLVMDVGGKNTYTCAYLTRLQGGVWRQSPRTQVCGKVYRNSFAAD